MNGKKINRCTASPVVLVAPLNWGLGHATRCIPLIRELLVYHCSVLVAAEPAIQSLLKQEFPQLRYLSPPAYRIRYSSRKSLLPFVLLLQAPRLLLTIYKEHRWLRKVAHEETIEFIISDNRFGMYHPSVPCIYITHQLQIKTGNRITEKTARWFHECFIRKYTRCWIPDYKEVPGLAGALSHVAAPPFNAEYIGALSRFEKTEAIEKKYDLLVILSGPEPQRTMLEELLLQQLLSFEGTALMVRGLPGTIQEEAMQQHHNDRLHIVHHLAAQDLNLAIQQSALVISRSGYTTVMDLIRLQQKAILIPTPGQTEQEYLARHLTEAHLFYTVEQTHFVLAEALEQVRQFPFCIPAYNMELYKEKIASLFYQGNAG